MAGERVFAVQDDDARLRAGARRREDLGAWVLDTGVQRTLVDDGIAAVLGLHAGEAEEVWEPVAARCAGPTPVRWRWRSEALPSGSPRSRLRRSMRSSPFLGRRVPG